MVDVTTSTKESARGNEDVQARRAELGGGKLHGGREEVVKKQQEDPRQQHIQGQQQQQLRVVVFEDGSCYVGEQQGSQRQGLGVFRSVTERMLYRGEWQRDMAEGYGDAVFEGPGTRFEGLFAKGNCRGPGRKLWPSGACFVGEFNRKGMPNGMGLYQSIGGDTICGTFQDGKCHGVGKCFYANGDTFLGQFKEGQREGLGVMYRDLRTGRRRAGSDVNPEQDEKGRWHNGSFAGKVSETQEAEKLEAVLAEADETITEAMEFCEMVQEDVLTRVRSAKRKANRLCVKAREVYGLEFDGRLFESAMLDDDEVRSTTTMESDNGSFSTATWNDSDAESLASSVANGGVVPGLYRAAGLPTKHPKKASAQQPRTKLSPSVSQQFLSDMQRKLFKERAKNQAYLGFSSRAGSDRSLGSDRRQSEDEDEPLVVTAANSKVHSIRGFISQKFGAQNHLSPTKLDKRIRSPIHLDANERAARRAAALTGERKARNQDSDGGDVDDDDDDSSSQEMLSARQYALLWKSLHPHGTSRAPIPPTTAGAFDRHGQPRFPSQDDDDGSSLLSAKPPSHPPPSFVGSIDEEERERGSLVEDFALTPRPPREEPPPPSSNTSSAVSSVFSVPPVPPVEPPPPAPPAPTAPPPLAAQVAPPVQAQALNRSSAAGTQPQAHHHYYAAPEKHHAGAGDPVFIEAASVSQIARPPFRRPPSISVASSSNMSVATTTTSPPSRPNTSPPRAPLRPPYPPRRPPLPPPLPSS